MALPTIQNANTSDGVRVAFHVFGQGPPVALLFPYHVNHLKLNWQVPLHRGATEYLARYFTVINLDFRGAGISERAVSSLSLDTFVEDLGAVLACLRIERISLCAMGDAALIAGHFASRWPDHVSRLVFIAVGESEVNRRVLSLRHVNPTLEAHLRGALLGGLDDERNAAALSAVAREALTPTTLRLWEQVLLQTRLSSVVSQVTAPTLCLHAAHDELVAIQNVQAVINSMESAILKTVPGKTGMDIWRDLPTMKVMTQFLAEGFGVVLNPSHASRRRGQKRTAYPCGLSEREMELLRLVAAGRTNQQISEDLFISLNTVSYHLRGIFNKTGAANRTEAASFAHGHELFVDPN